MAISLADRGPAASVIQRIAAAIGGGLTLFFCSTFTLGTVLVAPLGVLAARAVARRRQRPFTRVTAWVGALLISFIAVPVVFAGIFAMAPPGTVAAVRAAMDSAQAEQKPAEVPEWLRKMNPPAAEQQSAIAEKMLESTPFMMFSLIFGAVAMTALFGTIAGSIGWAASMLFGYAITGHWLPGGGERRVFTPADE